MENHGWSLHSRGNWHLPSVRSNLCMFCWGLTSDTNQFTKTRCNEMQNTQPAKQWAVCWSPVNSSRLLWVIWPPALSNWKHNPCPQKVQLQPEETVKPRGWWCSRYTSGNLSSVKAGERGKHKGNNGKQRGWWRAGREKCLEETRRARQRWDYAWLGAARINSFNLCSKQADAGCQVRRGQAPAEAERSCDSAPLQLGRAVHVLRLPHCMLATRH